MTFVQYVSIISQFFKTIDLFSPYYEMVYNKFNITTMNGQIKFRCRCVSLGLNPTFTYKKYFVKKEHMVYISRQVQRKFKGKSVYVCKCIMLQCIVGVRGLNIIKNQYIEIIYINTSIFFLEKLLNVSRLVKFRLYTSSATPHLRIKLMKLCLFKESSK